MNMYDMWLGKMSVLYTLVTFGHNVCQIFLIRFKMLCIISFYTCVFIWISIRYNPDTQIALTWLGINNNLQLGRVCLLPMFIIKVLLISQFELVSRCWWCACSTATTSTMFKKTLLMWWSFLRRGIFVCLFLAFLEGVSIFRFWQQSL